MEPDVSIETSSMIRVAVLPIGPVPHSLLRDYAAMLTRHSLIELASVTSFYTEHQKSPFAHQPWDSGSLQFRFLLGGSPPSPWEDFQSHRKILAVIGICHRVRLCSPDLDEVVDLFGSACRGYSSALATRCVAFCPGDSQLEDGQNRGDNLVLFPLADKQTQELHLLTMMQDLAASLLMEFEKWVLKAESSGTILKTPLDSQASLSSEEVIKARKRKLGRAQKTIGDYCLLAGSPVDAIAHYSTALELARLTGDFFWYAGALEGSVCALMLDRMGQIDPILEEEVKYRYNSVILHYRKSFIHDNAQRVSPLSFELEAMLKLARFLCRRELAKDVVDLLGTAADGAKSLIDASDRLILYVEIARLYGTLGYQRKAAFFSRQVAQLYMQQENRLAAISAMQILATTTKTYRVQSRASVSKPSNDIISSHADSGKTHHHSIVALFESQWSAIQMAVLREILLSAIRAGDPMAAWSAAARLLRSYYPLITPTGQNGLASALSNSAERLPSGIRCADPALPFIRLHSFPIHPLQVDLIKRDPARDDWWAGSAPSGPFIYTPFSKGDTSIGSKQEMLWIVGEPVQVLVELANPCGFDLVVDSIYLSVHTGNCDAFPISVKLPPNSSKVISLSGIPASVGSVKIPGCIVHCFGVISEHLFKDVDSLLLGAAQGLVLSDPFRSCGSPRLKNLVVPNILVISPLPLLVSRVVGGDGAITLYEGEIRDVWISLANAGTVPIEQAHIALSGKNQDAVISVSRETLQSVLPLKPGAEVTIPVTIKAWQLGLAEHDTAGSKNVSGSMGRQPKDNSSPMLLIYYAGSHANEQHSVTEKVVPYGRRLVVPLQICVLQGLSFVKARLLSMEIPADVTKNLPKSVPSEGSNNEASCPGRIDSLIKIDPNRGSWGLRFLELELYNPTDVLFEISVSFELENSSKLEISSTEDGLSYPKTRIDRDHSSRVLIPLEHFKLPVLDSSFFLKDCVQGNGQPSGRSPHFSDKSTNRIKNLISRIKVRWRSGRNSSGDLEIQDAVNSALQTSVMDVMLPDPLTFGFRLSRNSSKEVNGDTHDVSPSSKSPLVAHDMTPMEVLVRNNTRETIKMSLSITCRDVAGENCIEGEKATVLWDGILNDVTMEVPSLQETMHRFTLYFLVPGEYTLAAAALIEDANEVLRARAKTASTDEPIFCCGPPFRVRVMGTS